MLSLLACFICLLYSLLTSFFNLFGISLLKNLLVWAASPESVFFFHLTINPSPSPVYSNSASTLWTDIPGLLLDSSLSHFSKLSLWPSLPLFSRPPAFPFLLPSLPSFLFLSFSPSLFLSLSPSPFLSLPSPASLLLSILPFFSPSLSLPHFFMLYKCVQMDRMYCKSSLEMIHFFKAEFYYQFPIFSPILSKQRYGYFASCFCFWQIKMNLVNKNLEYLSFCDFLLYFMNCSFIHAVCCLWQDFLKAELIPLHVETTFQICSHVSGHLESQFL